jgi:hypothetical protein
LIANLEGATWTSAEQAVLNRGKRIASSIELIADNDEGSVVRAREVRDFKVHDSRNQPSGQNGVIEGTQRAARERCAPCFSKSKSRDEC